MAPAARKQGIGRRLVGPIRQWGEVEGAVRLRLGALADNPAAEAFWSAMGARALSVAYTIELKEGTFPEVQPRRPIGFF